MTVGETLGLIFEIAADPSKAMAALEAVKAKAQETAAAAAQGNQAVAASAEAANTTEQAMGRTIAQSLQMQGATAEQAAQVYKQLGISGTRAGAEIQAAFGSATPAIEAAGASSQSFRQELRADLGDRQALRRAMYAVFTPVMFAYIIPEITRMGQGIAEVAKEVGGLDTGFQQLMTDAVADNDKLLGYKRQLNVAQQMEINLIKDANTQRLRTIQIELENAKAAQATAHATALNLQGQIDLFRLQAEQVEAIGGGVAAIGVAIAKRIEGIDKLQKALDEQQKSEIAAGKDVAALEGELAVPTTKQAAAAEVGRTAAEDQRVMIRNWIAFWRDHWRIMAENLRQEQELQRNADRLKIEEDRATWDLYIDNIKRARKEQDAIYAEMEARGRMATRIWVQEHKQAADATDKLTKAYGLLEVIGGRTYAELTRMALEYRGQAVSAHKLVAAAIAAESLEMLIAAAVGEQSFKMMIRQLAEYVEKKAVIHAAMDIALMLEAIAHYDFAAAGHYAAAAAAWLALGGAAAATASAVGYGSSMGAQPAAAAAWAPSATPGSAAGAGGPQQTTVIQVDGSIKPDALYAGRAIINLVQAINKAQSSGTVRLIITAPPVVRS